MIRSGEGRWGRGRSALYKGPGWTSNVVGWWPAGAFRHVRIVRRNSFAFRLTAVLGRALSGRNRLFLEIQHHFSVPNVNGYLAAIGQLAKQQFVGQRRAYGCLL